MQEWKKSLIKLFVYAGMEKHEYAGIKRDIYNKNMNMLSIGILMALAVFCEMFLVSSGVGFEEDRRLYAIVIAALLVLLLVKRRLIRYSPKLILPCCYCLLLIVLSFSILLGSFMDKDMPSSTFCVLLLVSCLLFIDRIYRMALFLILMTVIFCVTVYHQKAPEIARIDIANALTFLALSIICSAYLLHMKVRDLVNSRRMRHEVDTDGLTGLLVKTAAEREIRDYINTTRAPGTLIMIDVDDFKQINDTMGHAFGDVVLKLIGGCINTIFRKGDIKGRFGGDEFIIFLPDTSNREVISERLDRFRALLSQESVKNEGGDRGIHQSIGIAIYPEDAQDYQGLFDKADEALYEAKHRGKNQYCFYTSVKIRKRG